MSASLDKPVIIVVSSHVARGSVGNRAIVFALERLGLPVVAVPSVLLTWHPGVGPATRIVPPAEAFGAMIDDITTAPWLGKVGAILSGYLGAEDQAESVATLVEAVKALNPEALYLCDPVIGDVAGSYVSSQIVAAISSQLLPLADVATPNRHELGLLENRELSDNSGLVGAARNIGVEEVVVTSAFAGRDQASNLLVTADSAHRVTHPSLSSAPHGTGDLFSGLYLARRLAGIEAPDALRLAVGSVLRLIEIAAGAENLPLAEGQAAIFEPHRAVSLEKVE